MSAYEPLCQRLKNSPSTWLITGVAGFIGSNLLEALLRLDQLVVGLDNFATGKQKNLDEVRSLVTKRQWMNFHLIQGDIRSLAACRRAMVFHKSSSKNVASKNNGRRVDFVLHQAALGSVPRSLLNPIATHRTNVDGFLNILIAARDAKIKRLVYAASSSAYGDFPGRVKIEGQIGRPLSPYAVTKIANELYAEVFARAYNIESIGLRYFNVFGPRQAPDGPYAAVIPKWTAALLQHKTVYVNGDGETSRDFCYIDNVVQANLLAATAKGADAVNQVYNIAVGEKTTLNVLFDRIVLELRKHVVLKNAERSYRPFRDGDVRHSLADISKARRLLSYEPTQRINQGLEKAVKWYVKQK